MTLGERIHVKRKEAGMSQEDLGSRLEVSRQTVYKWESDQAIPELNKLIAMAELFGVKVGWLIAEEEDDRKSADYDEVVKRLKEIIEANERQEREKPVRSIPIWLVSILVFVMAFAFLKLYSMERKYQELDRVIERNNAYTQRAIANISSNVSEVLNNYNSITVGTTVNVKKVDFFNNLVTFAISAQPKTYTNGMKAVFHVEMGGKIYDFQGLENNSKTFVVEAEVPLTDNNAEISVEFITGDVSEVARINTYYELLAQTFPWYDIIGSVDPVIKSDYSGFNDPYLEVIEQNIRFDYADLYGTAFVMPEIVSIEAFLTEDGEKIADYVYDEEFTFEQNGHSLKTPEGQGETVSVYWHYFKRPTDIKLTLGKEYTEHFIATDEYGRQVEVTSREGEQIIEYHVE